MTMLTSANLLPSVYDGWPGQVMSTSATPRSPPHAPLRRAAVRLADAVAPARRLTALRGRPARADRIAGGGYRWRVAQDPALAEAVAAAVLALPGVVRLSGGKFGTVASYLPGRRVVGVRLPLEETDSVEVALVARMGVPLPPLVGEVGAAVVAVLGPVAVDVTVTDVEEAPSAAAEVAVGRGAGLA